MPHSAPQGEGSRGHVPVEGRPADQRAGRRHQQQAGVLHPQRPPPTQHQALPPGPQEWSTSPDGGARLRDDLRSHARCHGNDSAISVESSEVLC